MSLTFSYNSGASTVAFTRDPQMGNISQARQFRSPVIKSGGGKLFVYNKSVTRNTLTLTWLNMDPTDLANLLTFLDAVDGSSNEFDLITNLIYRSSIVWDAGISWASGIVWADAPVLTMPARYMEPKKLLWTPAEIMERDWTIELMVYPS